MIDVQIYQSETLCSILVSCGDRSVKGLLTCCPPYEDKSALYNARVVCRRHLDPRFEPCALERTTTDEITGEERDDMVQWLVWEMQDEIRSLCIHERMMRLETSEKVHAPAV